MARGQKYNDDLKEKAFALLAVNNSVSFVAKELGLPRSTVKTWKEVYDKEADESGEPTITKLRQEKREEFIANAWGLIGKVQTLLERRLDRAIGSENVIDELLDEILKLGHKDLTETQRKALYSKIAAIKVENVKELAVVLGTLYDKQALADNKATQNINVSGTIKFEDIEE